MPLVPSRPLRRSRLSSIDGVGGSEDPESRPRVTLPPTDGQRQGLVLCDPECTLGRRRYGVSTV